MCTSPSDLQGSCFLVWLELSKQHQAEKEVIYYIIVYKEICNREEAIFMTGGSCLDGPQPPERRERHKNTFRTC